MANGNTDYRGFPTEPALMFLFFALYLQAFHIRVFFFFLFSYMQPCKLWQTWASLHTKIQPGLTPLNYSFPRCLAAFLELASEFCQDFSLIYSFRGEESRPPGIQACIEKGEIFQNGQRSQLEKNLELRKGCFDHEERALWNEGYS